MDAFAEVKDRLTMREVLQQYGYEVNRAGYALCPFHSDHHPSMKVYEKSFYCFSCGTGGDLINFVAQLNGVRNIDACKELAQEFGIVIDAPAGSAQDFRAKMAREKREREKRENEKFEHECSKANMVLSAMMRYLNEGKYAKEYPDKQHIRALQMYDECAYYCDLIDSEPRSFLTNNREVIKRYETTLDRWYNEEQAI